MFRLTDSVQRTGAASFPPYILILTSSQCHPHFSQNSDKICLLNIKLVFLSQILLTPKFIRIFTVIFLDFFSHL